MPGFEPLVQRFLDELFELQPDVATRIGDHQRDGTWPDVTEAGRLARLGFVDRWEAELRAVDDATLDAGERIDRDLLLGQLDHGRFDDAVLREETWNPLVWVYVLGGGIHPLLAREFAPLSVRLESVAGRLEGIPVVLDGARASLGAHPDRPVSGFWPRRPRSGSLGSRVSPTRRSPQAKRRRRQATPMSPRCCPVSGRRPRRHRRHSSASGGTSRMRLHPLRPGARSSGRRCSRRSFATPFVTRR